MREAKPQPRLAGSKACSNAGPHGSSRWHRLTKRRGSYGLCWCVEKPIACRQQSQVAQPEAEGTPSALPQLTGEEGDGGVMANRSNPELGRTRQVLCAFQRVNLFGSQAADC